MNDKKQICPKCGSDLVIVIGNALHCNACGNHFDCIQTPTPRKSEKRGWPSGPAYRKR